VLVRLEFLGSQKVVGQKSKAIWGGPRKKKKKKKKKVAHPQNSFSLWANHLSQILEIFTLLPPEQKYYL